MRKLFTLFAAIVCATSTWAATVNLSTISSDYTAPDGTTLTGTLSANVKISIAAGATVTLNNVTINGSTSSSYPWAGLTCLGNATLVITGTNSITGFYQSAGIFVPSSGVLTIQGTGSLTASGQPAAAGIGASSTVNAGGITINSGTITAIGGSYASGIGAGYGKTCGTITIFGGTVTATGGSGSAGIGAGYGAATCYGAINIANATVTAIGGSNGAGIGNGYSSTCQNIAITNSTVTATGGNNGAGIGCGSDGMCQMIAITRSTVTATAGSNSVPIGQGKGRSCGMVIVTNVTTDDNASPTRHIVYSPASVTSTPSAKSLFYTGSAQALVNAGTASGGTINYSTDNSTWSTSIPTGTEVGNYTVYYKVVGDANHADFTPLPNTVAVTIDKATPTVTAPTPKSLTYTGSAQTLVNTGSTTGGTLQYKLGSGSWGTSISTATAAGNYTVYYKVVGNSNYNAVAEQSVSVTINKAPLTCTADNKSVTYGDAAPTYSATYSGWVNSETQAVLGGSLAFACDYSAGSDVDDYIITPNGVSASNYDIMFNTGTLTVNPASLTCTADNKSVTYGDAAPTYTATYSGWVNSETQAVLTGTLAFACDYSAGSNVGDYIITPSGVTSGNYTITFNTGTLTVNKADAVITDTPAAVEGLVYTGAAQTLISAGSATGGELQYKVDASAWSTDLPQATAIGDHTVYYKVVGDGNHNSLDESSFTVSIAAVTVLYDNTDPTTDIAGMVEAGEAYDLTVSRTIYADGYFNTICLPFAVSAGELSNPAHPLYGYTDLKAFSGAEVTGSGQNLFINIYVEDATEIAAGVPYLVSYPGNRADILNPTFPAAVCTATAPDAVTRDGVTFQGMFAPVHITTYAENTTEDYLFLGENNRLLWPNDDGSSMRGFRAYFIIHRNNIPAAAAPRGTAARIMQRDNTATGIEQVQGDEVQSTKLLRDGQLIIIRNGVEYNANGQMLK